MARQSGFSIEYAIEKIDCDSPADDSNTSYEGFMLHAIIGRAMLHLGNQSIGIGRCGLLALSRSLIRLCTFPALYGLEAFETVIDLPTDFRASIDKENVVICVSSGSAKETKFVVSLDEAMREIGAFHRGLLSELFVQCPQIKNHGLLLVRIPDAFALAHVGI